MKGAGRVSGSLLVVSAAILMLGLPPSLTWSHPSDTAYDNTLAKDFIMDAPWRVIDSNTTIPITIVLKDCDVDDIRDLHWIRCTDVTYGGSTILWHHDFNDETIGNDASEHNYWTYITTVTEGHPALPNGTLLTPANLGYATGDEIQLKVEVYYRDDWFNYTETRHLRVHVGSGPFPWPEDWYGGDTHYHTMYTNNIAEFGAPLPCVRETSKALGLHWLITTDHSCDLDETGDGAFSYATLHWEYTIQGPSGTQTVYRNNVAYGSTWNALGADVTDFSDSAFRLYRGVEINLASIDSDSYDKTLHCLFYNPDYISSPLSGAFGERPVRPQLHDGLAQLSAMNGFAYAAHPLSDLGAEWGGIDWTVNGSVWGNEDIDLALQYDAFRGLQAFNTRSTRYSSDQNNPWSDFDDGETPDDPYPNGLLLGISLWDDLLRRDLNSPRPKIFFSGGSDAHGDFNYASFLSLDNYATDNAIGKVQTVAFAPGDYGPGNLPPTDEILLALREGRTVVTDGPFLEIGLDRDGDDDWYEAGDLMIGEDGTADPSQSLPMKIRWASLPEFGQVASVKLIVGDAAATTVLHQFDPRIEGEGYSGSASFDLGGLGFTGLRYFRAECLTSDGDAGHRAYTNPIWIDFDPTSDVEFADQTPGRPVLLPCAPNPVGEVTRISFDLPSSGPASLAIYDLRGALVRTLARNERFSEGRADIEWDRRDDRGEIITSGVYFCRLAANGQIRLSTVVLLGNDH